MSTRAIIKFTAGDEEILLDRTHDGFPDIILDDIAKCLAESERRWSRPEMGCLVSLFISMNYDYKKKRLPHYTIIAGYPGDTNYRYHVTFNRETKKWEYGIQN